MNETKKTFLADYAPGDFVRLISDGTSNPIVMSVGLVSFARLDGVPSYTCRWVDHDGEPHSNTFGEVELEAALQTTTVIRETA